MSFLYFLEDIRNPFLDAFFSTITHLGSETLFLAIAIIVFWCFSKKGGYYLLTVGFFGTLINQFLKITCQVPRPWVKDPDFTIVESAREDATGYSFPSGHTASVTSTLGSSARMVNKTWARAVLIALVLLTGLSRMYLGVHTPADVLVSLTIGIVLIFAVHPVFEKSEDKPVYAYVTFAALAVISFSFLLFVELNPWPADIDTHNLESAVKNGYTMFGCSAALIIAFHVDRKYINFGVKAPWWAQILKTVIGLALVLALKSGLKPVFMAVFGGHIGEAALRYFILVIFAGVVWPLTFKWFSGGCKLKK